MKQNPRTRGAIALTSIALALSSFATVATAAPAAPTPPDLTAGSVREKTRRPKPLLRIDTADAIPLRDAKHRKNMFVASLTGGAIRGTEHYEVNFDTGSSQLCLPYGCLDKSKITVLEANTGDCWGHKADRVKGQIAMVSRDGKTTYCIDDYVFYAMKNEDGSDWPADPTAGMNDAIMGAYPCPEAFTYKLAEKYCREGFVYGIVSEKQVGDMVENWDAFKAYLKIGLEASVAAQLNWHNYTPWFEGQTELQAVNIPGWTVTLSFPPVAGVALPDIVVSNQIATIDTGAPDLTLRLGKDDPHRRAPYHSFFNSKTPHWYDKAKCQAGGDNITVRIAFTGSSGQTEGYQWTLRDPQGRYVPNGLIVGDWTAGIPWGEGAETPLNRFNLGNSIYFYLQAHVWDIKNKRIGFHFNQPAPGPGK